MAKVSGPRDLGAQSDIELFSKRIGQQTADSSSNKQQQQKFSQTNEKVESNLFY